MIYTDNGKRFRFSSGTYIVWNKSLHEIDISNRVGSALYRVDGVQRSRIPRIEDEQTVRAFADFLAAMAGCRIREVYNKNETLSLVFVPLPRPPRQRTRR